MKKLTASQQKELDKLHKDLLRKERTNHLIDNSRLGNRLHNDNIVVSGNYKNDNDLSLIIEKEKLTMSHILKKYGNSQGMESSYKRAILELEIIFNHTDKVENPTDFTSKDFGLKPQQTPHYTQHQRHFTSKDFGLKPQQ